MNAEGEPLQKMDFLTEEEYLTYLRIFHKKINI